MLYSSIQALFFTPHPHKGRYTNLVVFGSVPLSEMYIRSVTCKYQMIMTDIGAVDIPLIRNSPVLYPCTRKALSTGSVYAASKKTDSLTSGTVNYWRKLQARQSTGYSSTRNVRARFYQPYISRRALTSSRYHDKDFAPSNRTHLKKT